MLHVLGVILLVFVVLFVLALIFFWVVLALAPGSRYKQRAAADSRALRSAAEKFAQLQAE